MTPTGPANPQMEPTAIGAATGKPSLWDARRCSVHTAPANVSLHSESEELPTSASTRTWYRWLRYHSGDAVVRLHSNPQADRAGQRA